jgi:catechol 1,2-dioxygenase
MNHTGIDRRSLLRLGALLPGAAALMAAPASAVPDGTCEPTRSDNKGPFYISGAPRRTSIAGPREPGERVRIRGTVLAADCRTPLAGALVDVWQADATGEYLGRGEQFRLRGQILTNARGEYEFETIKPGQYDIGDGMRPAHIHFTVSSPEYEPVTTQLYFAADPQFGEKDPCGSGCDSDDPKRIIQPKKDGRGPAVGRFDIILRPARET